MVDRAGNIVTVIVERAPFSVCGRDPEMHRRNAIEGKTGQTRNSRSEFRVWAEPRKNQCRDARRSRACEAPIGSMESRH